ncbi:MAG TPA: nuclear transport factor 2 family protein [Rhodanobacter sp.]|jgi:ketosteroid isomerase-like protein|nr:nuclear transport factor 2 family protein [Rhodanobacter sp.]
MTTLSRLFRRNPMPGLATRFALAMLLAVPWQAALSASDEVSQEVYAAERAFARSMADRDMAAFARHVSEEAVFFNGTGVLRGKPEVMATWSRFFQGKTAPFSWDPDRVEVLQSGTLALSTGLVRDPDGKIIGRFNSVWRREAEGVWRVVFDKGSPAEK